MFSLRAVCVLSVISVTYVYLFLIQNYPRAAAVSNAGGLGVIGGVGYTPDFLRKQIAEMKSHFVDKNAPFGIDLLLPKVGGGARATNYDYTKGQLPELIDIIIESGAKLFVSAVGVPPEWAVQKLHAAGIYVMNMCGHVKHVPKAIAVGADLVCCQGISNRTEFMSKTKFLFAQLSVFQYALCV